MIVDFQHHYTPKDLFDARGGGGDLTARLDQDGNPSYTLNPLLTDLDAHIRMMDKARIDVAVLSCGEGFDNPDLKLCQFINDKMKEAEEDYPGRFIGLAHVPALNATDGPAEVERCAKDLEFPGIVIGSELQGEALDSEDLYPLWQKVCDLGLYVFVHPLPSVIAWDKMHVDDLGRVLGWEFSLMVATVRMINAGVLDEFPYLKVQFAHMSGGVGRYLSRIRGFAERDHWGTADNERHGRRPLRPYDHYINERLMYDCAGWVGPVDTAQQGIEWIRHGLDEAALTQIVFATDYPQAIRTDEDCVAYTDAVRALGETGEAILSGNATKLIPNLPTGRPL
jgi:predicted TIM-barrel fold metal-dependent hydrolase